VEDGQFCVKEVESMACVCCSHCSEHPWRLRSETFVPGKKSIFALTPKRDEEAEQQIQCAGDDSDEDADDDDDDDDDDDAVDLAVTMTDDNHVSQCCNSNSLSVHAAVPVHSGAAPDDSVIASSNETSHEI